VDARIVIVGDEILSGHVQDANGHFIAARLAATGHRLRHISVVPDAPDAIVDAVRTDLASGIAFLFVCGGLGPTHDDRTMESVALALGVGLEPCEPLAERIAVILEHMRNEGFKGDPLGIDGLRKMELAPAGSEFLRCDAGVIPAVTLMHGETRIFILPGPPRELQTVFVESVEPQYLEPTGTQLTRLEIEHGFPESSLAATLTEVEASHPGVSVGSYPGRGRVLLRIAGPEQGVHSAAEGIRAAIEALESSEEGRRLLEMMQARRQMHEER
jgi:nicotinamide-nucleotide amidase